MAFCNSCGATLADGTQFCNKCGAAVAGNPSGMAPARPVQTPMPAPPPSSGSSNALKIILVVVGAIVLIGVLGLVTVGFVVHRMVRNSHVTQNGDNVKVETPFGTIESSKDPEQAAKDLGIDIYPGAQVQKTGAASATFGGMHTVTAKFESSDSVDKVCTFYRAKFPGANVTTSDQNHCTIVSNAPPNMVTINVDSDGDGSKFLITSVSKKTTSNQ
jgi:hypothetical protein